MSRHYRHHTQPPTYGKSAPADINTAHGLKAFDAASRDMDIKWGVSRLAELVSVETAHIWDQTMGNLNKAIAGTERPISPRAAQADLTACVESALKGFAYMDAEAERIGAAKADRSIIEYDDGQGFRFGIVRDDADWQAAKDARSDLKLFTMREVSMSLKGIGAGDGLLGMVKDKFPNAKITEVRPKSEKLPGAFWRDGSNRQGLPDSSNYGGGAGGGYGTGGAGGSDMDGEDIPF